MSYVPSIPNKPVHVAVVGGGISAAYTLTHLLGLLRQEPPKRILRVAVFEKSGEFWPGVPYGRRSGRNSLIITSLREFLPEPERQDFVRWLGRRCAEICDPGGVAGWRLTAEWRQRHAGDMRGANWDELFIPRGLFGAYLQENMTRLLEAAAAEGYLECALIPCEVLDVEATGDGYWIHTASAGNAKSRVGAEKVVLALGSPPNRPCAGAAMADPSAEVCLVENIYEPGLDENIEKVSRALERLAARGRNQVAIVGSNASALETIYSLTDRVTCAERITRFIVISPAGRFPHRIGNGGVPAGYRAAHLEQLTQGPASTAAGILRALEQDVEATERSGINVADVFHLMSKHVIEAFNQLNLEEQGRFVSEYGVRIGKLQRRAGPEYRDAVELLSREGRLEVLKGTFRDYIPEAEGGPGLQYVEAETRLLKRCQAPLGAIINCGGFLDVTEWPAPLIQRLQHRGLCTANHSRRGFVLNERFESSPGCFVIGPLVAGNLNRAMRVWHAESCSRIISLSRQLAGVLVEQFCGGK